jgi:ABC-type sugar transport system ATPase subunit
MVEAEVTKLLDMQGIVKRFGGTVAVNGVDFDCAHGEVHGLVGENGAGKSTLMKVLVGVHSPDDGRIFINGDERKFVNFSEARKAGIGVVYQELSLLPQMTVAENIALGVWPKSKSGLIKWSTIRTTSIEILKSIGVDINPDLLISSLPIALRQMVEIGKMLAQKPELIVFDEPTAPLSHDEVIVLFNLIKDLKNQGKGIVFISHRLDEVLSISDRITVMKDGKKVISDQTSNFNEKKLISSMIGREISEVFPAKHALTGKERELFAYESILNRSNTRVKFSIHEGEVLGVGGLQGQGQLELLHSIFGLGGCEDLSICIEGNKVSIKNPRQAMRRGIALLPENRNEEGVFLILSTLSNLTSTTIHRRQKMGFVDKRAELQAVRKMIEQLSIKVSSYRQVAQSLSGGNMQKLVVGKWLIFNPRVIVLLEPTKGVDVSTKQQIYLIISQLADSGVAVVINTSDMLELIGLCNRVLVMNQGYFTASLSGKQITEESIMEASVSNKQITDTETHL